jgi:hypothetical protein
LLIFKLTIGTTIGSFLGFVTKFVSDAQIIRDHLDDFIKNKRSEVEEKTREQREQLEKLTKKQFKEFKNIKIAASETSPSSFFGGAKKTKKHPKGTGGYSAPKKISKGLEHNIQVMQSLQENFAVYARTLDIKEDRETGIEKAVHTAKPDVKGANADGKWGPNTQASLETIQKYIDNSKVLKDKINKKLHTAQPAAGESESEINKNVINNVKILTKSQALLGDPKYAKHLSQVIKDSNFDSIPKFLQDPNESDPDSFMPVEGGISISSRQLSSLGGLKVYLNNNGYTPMGSGV